MSSPVTHQTLTGLTPDEQCDYLTHFRADSIVKDAEAIRKQFNVKKWAILGQSFGGILFINLLIFIP